MLTDGSCCVCWSLLFAQSITHLRVSGDGLKGIAGEEVFYPFPADKRANVAGDVRARINMTRDSFNQVVADVNWDGQMTMAQALGNRNKVLQPIELETACHASIIAALAGEEGVRLTNARIAVLFPSDSIKENGGEQHTSLTELRFSLQNIDWLAFILSRCCAGWR